MFSSAWMSWKKPTCFQLFIINFVHLFSFFFSLIKRAQSFILIFTLTLKVETRNLSSSRCVFLCSQSAAVYELQFRGCDSTDHIYRISVGKALANEEERLLRRAVSEDREGTSLCWEGWVRSLGSWSCLGWSCLIAVSGTCAWGHQREQNMWRAPLYMKCKCMLGAMKSDSSLQFWTLNQK